MIITSTANERVKLVRQLQARRRARQQEDAFVVEGVRLLEEAASAQVEPRFVLYSEDAMSERAAALVERLRALGAQAWSVTPAVMSACSSAETAPGILAVLANPHPAMPEALSLAIVADGISDPGNLGTLLRTAWAAGVGAAFLTEGTVDPYNPKVLRGAMGAHFHLPIEVVRAEELGARLKGFSFWLAEAGGGVRYDEVDWRGPSALVIGSEAHGAGPTMRGLARGSVSIPMPGGSESLNAAVAAAVILFEIVRQRGIG
jgi:TrmH family RNA methyltransferase